MAVHPFALVAVTVYVVVTVGVAIGLAAVDDVKFVDGDHLYVDVFVELVFNVVGLFKQTADNVGDIEIVGDGEHGGSFVLFTPGASWECSSLFPLPFSLTMYISAFKVLLINSTANTSAIFSHFCFMIFLIIV